MDYVDEETSQRSHENIDVVYNVTEDTFGDIYAERQPVVLRGLELGPCMERWTVDYLAENGGEKEVKIHVSQTPQMDFINKNFMYRSDSSDLSTKSLPFCDLVKRASQDFQAEYFAEETEKYYLRALGDDPRKDKADIKTQFPALAEDITIPPFFSEEKFFSSVFRIASPGLQLWTHYDVSAVNIRGLVGDKSEVLDIDNVDEEKYPLFKKAERFEVFLEPGDVLFIPALWFHNVISLDFGVAVNVFWKHLDDQMYDNKDTYGNKDPLPAGRAFQIADRAIKALEELPEEYRDFYARRLINRIENKAVISDENLI
ncbi:TYW5-like protein [Mya arenaria]|uniref:TYW5-like protein n=1 Tax=Mya arenaria TaxID=6604 RepID=A0ABY7ELQ4_MYAAR|nr:TYW5-like protein [Mya arenaria]